MWVEREAPGCLVSSGTCLGSGRGCWWLGLDRQAGHPIAAVRQVVTKRGCLLGWRHGTEWTVGGNCVSQSPPPRCGKWREDSKENVRKRLFIAQG